MAEQATKGTSAPNDQEKPVILIADDSRVVRVSLKNILKNDCQLVEAEDGLQAWELLLEHPRIQLIFSDLSMPRLDGRGLLKKIRQSEITRIRNLPFIVVTGNEEDAETRQELQDDGATEMVRKPFDPAKIVSFASTLISRQDDESYLLLPEEEKQSESLAGAANQSHFMEVASRELSFAIRNKNELAVALLKIDQFDSISTHYSDPAVEHILLTTVEIIHHHIHPDDTMAYFGNGVYAILRPASNAIGTRYIGRRILEDLRAKQFYLGETDEVISASVGISAPEIKRGTRLKELLLLAEGRLKAAIDLGGNRVIDKGNDTLTPVSTVTDSTQDISTSSYVTHTGSAKSGQSHHSMTLGDLQRVSSDPDEALKQISTLTKQLDQLAEENRSLQAQVDRWHKQSAESEQLRQRVFELESAQQQLQLKLTDQQKAAGQFKQQAEVVEKEKQALLASDKAREDTVKQANQTAEQFRQRVFELESEQQQIQVKLTDLQSENARLKRHAESMESEKQQLMQSDEERTATIRQANQYYEQENLRLEGQLDALSNRAQKAEAENRKSEQLILSLKDNIALLRGQLEQVQGQLEAARRMPPPDTSAAQSNENHAEAPSASAEARDAQAESSDSDLIFDPFPTGQTVRKEKPPAEKASVVNIFPEKAPEPVQPPLSRDENKGTQQPLPSVPLYRVEKEAEPLPRESKPHSSFAIASLILILFLALGGSYLYSYMQETSDTVKEIAKSEETPSPPADALQSDVGNGGGDSAENPLPARGRLPRPAKAATAQASSQIPSARTEEAKLEAELTLRQMAEEKFNEQLQQVNEEQQPVTSPAQTENPPAPAVPTATTSAAGESPGDPLAMPDQPLVAPAVDRVQPTPDRLSPAAVVPKTEMIEQ